MRSIEGTEVPHLSSVSLSFQDVRPWNGEFSQELAEDSPLREREFIAGNDAVTLATDILPLDQDAYSVAFRKSPMKRASLAGSGGMRRWCLRTRPEVSVHKGGLTQPRKRALMDTELLSADTDGLAEQ
jgi:hypothetical protein